MQVNWGLLQPVDVGGMFDRGVQQGRQQRIERETDNALRAYAQNPDDPNAVNALLRFNPQMGMQLQQQQADRQRQQQTRAQTAGALGGNMQDLFGLAQSDPEQFARIRPQIEQINRTIGQIAQASTTPEQWDANVTRLAEMYGEGFLRYRGRFDLREVAIAQAGEMQQFLESNRPRIVPVAAGGSVAAMDPDGSNMGYIVSADRNAPAYVPRSERPPAPATPQAATAPQDLGNILTQARDAIRQGADPAAVAERLRSLGVDPTALDMGGRMSRSQAGAVLQSMNGDRAQFDRWVRDNNIQIVE